VCVSFVRGGEHLTSDRHQPNKRNQGILFREVRHSVIQLAFQSTNKRNREGEREKEGERQTDRKRERRRWKKSDTENATPCTSTGNIVINKNWNQHDKNETPLFLAYSIN